MLLNITWYVLPIENAECLFGGNYAKIKKVEKSSYQCYNSREKKGAGYDEALEKNTGCCSASCLSGGSGTWGYGICYKGEKGYYESGWCKNLK